MERRRLLKRGFLGAAGLTMLGAAAPVLAATGKQRLLTITNARVFDGEWLLSANTVIVENGLIAAVGRELKPRGSVVDARGGTLLPGLIDAHTHTFLEQMADALRFGVTTELDMGGEIDPEKRRQALTNDRVADYRSSYYGVTPPGGHPAQLIPPGVHVPSSDIKSADAARRHVDFLVSKGADYVKVLIEDGRVLGSPGLPELSTELVKASVDAAHGHGKLVVAHALTVEATERALDGGVDGFTHLFIDRPHTAAIVSRIAASDAFVIPCLTLNQSIMGGSAKALAEDPRVKARLNPHWASHLGGSMNDYKDGDFRDVLATAGALHRAGVDLLVGTDASVPAPNLAGVAHGASVHDELRLLVAAGLTPIEALRAATSVTARRFELRDRGRIIPSLRADLLLVDGDPTKRIADTLSIRKVWKRGVELVDSKPLPAQPGGHGP